MISSVAVKKKLLKIFNQKGTNAMNDASTEEICQKVRNVHKNGHWWDWLESFMPVQNFLSAVLCSLLDFCGWFQCMNSRTSAIGNHTQKICEGKCVAFCHQVSQRATSHCTVQIFLMDVACQHKKLSFTPVPKMMFEAKNFSCITKGKPCSELMKVIEINETGNHFVFISVFCIQLCRKSWNSMFDYPHFVFHLCQSFTKIAMRGQGLTKSFVQALFLLWLVPRDTKTLQGQSWMENRLISKWISGKVDFETVKINGKVAFRVSFVPWIHHSKTTSPFVARDFVKAEWSLGWEWVHKTLIRVPQISTHLFNSNGSELHGGVNVCFGFWSPWFVFGGSISGWVCMVWVGSFLQTKLPAEQFFQFVSLTLAVASHEVTPNSPFRAVAVRLVGQLAQWCILHGSGQCQWQQKMLVSPWTNARKCHTWDWHWFC